MVRVSEKRTHGLSCSRTAAGMDRCELALNKEVEVNLLGGLGSQCAVRIHPRSKVLILRPCPNFKDPSHGGGKAPSNVLDSCPAQRMAVFSVERFPPASSAPQRGLDTHQLVAADNTRLTPKD